MTPSSTILRSLDLAILTGCISLSGDTSAYIAESKRKPHAERILWRSVRRPPVFRSIPPEAFRPQAKLIRRIAGQSVPATLNVETIALGIFVLTYFVRHYGNEAVAALGIATRIGQLVLMMQGLERSS